MNTRNLFALLAFLVFAVAASAAELILEFDGNNPAGSVEYFAELKVGTGAGATWTEVGKADASPITLAGVQTGTHTLRVKARNKADIKLVSAPSNEVTATVLPITPANLKITVTLTLSTQ